MFDRRACLLCAAVLLSSMIVPIAWAQSGTKVRTLPGTKPLTITQPLDEVMVAGIDRFALRELKASVARRAQYWNRDYSSAAAYTKSVAANRELFREIIGVVDPREPAAGFELLATTTDKALVAETAGYSAYAVRWPVLDGVTGEGLLLQPKGKIARAIRVGLNPIAPRRIGFDFISSRSNSRID